MGRMGGRDYLRARGRTAVRVAGSMNKTEAAFATLLDREILLGQAARYWYEGIKLKLASGAFYTPDFMVLRPDGRVDLYEVKPGTRNGALWTPDARLRVRLAAATYPLFYFKSAWRYGGVWREESFDRAEFPPEEVGG